MREFRDHAVDAGPLPTERRTSRCLLIFVTLLPILLICNPLVLGAAFAEDARIELAYILLLDLLVLGIMGLCYRFVRTQKPFYHRAALIGLIALPFTLATTEALILRFRADYQRLMGTSQRPDISANSVLQRHDSFGWWLRPGASSHTPKIRVDEAGRRQTQAPADGVTATIHAFGDSFLFGQGVDQEAIALNLLAERFHDRAGVLNYAVSGYGLEQMVLRLEAALATIEPGDLVLFAPITNDFRRNLIAKQLVCTHYDEGFAGDRFPRWIDGGWRHEALQDHCPELGLPLNRLLSIAKKSLGITERQLIANADQVLQRAKRLAEKNGATFALVFQPNYKECRKGRFDLDIEALTVPHRHLMPACAEFDPTVDYTLSPSDYHWNEQGHRWLANALANLIEAEGLIETDPTISNHIPPSLPSEFQVSF